MIKAAITFLATALGLALMLMTQTAFADENQAIFHYDIQLAIPDAQRKLLEDNLDLYRWQNSERMDDIQLKRLVKLAPDQIREFLGTEGYYSPRIEANVAHKNGTWAVMLVVEPGEPVHVTAFDLQVTGPFDDSSTENRTRLEKMRANWGLRPGAVFRHDDWESAKRNALKSLLLDRYPAASIADSLSTVNPEAKSAELQVTLNSGPAFTFGKLEIKGLQRYPASIIERMNPVKPGEPYSQAKLLGLQSRIQDSPYFASAAVSADTDPDHPTSVPIQVEVVEAKSQKLGFGIGMSTDTGARGQVDYRDLNFLDRAWRLSGALKLDQKVQSLNGDLQFPLTENGYRDSIYTQIERTNIVGLVTKKIAFGPKRTFISGKTETSYGLRYLVEQQDIDGGASTKSTTLSPSYSWTIRNIDNVLYPTRGYLVNLQADAASRAMLSSQNFLRGYGRGVFFYPLGKRDQLILRGEFGMVAAKSRDGIPSDFLFRTGGDQTVRGYGYQTLGVHDGNAVLGGRYLTVASAEYVHWLSSQWGAAVFVDGGNAADSLNGLKPVYGYGAGARWKSPVGPLNLDIAYGQDKKEVRMHFSLGFNF
ncbi:autotransporter assembly complex protein TamA [Sulfurirhabdus autotrophica]|uniref:Translocation and assembly module subunit TamA n=1 Tax=Sulfurirhabdus autotrophica TaxID=1706046 RepID=A0A4R3YD76_9PROT|nr:autotransporter assembly complex family protein [Sulfurirhabdus autotrophica]TCV89058.1 autotransporter secretion outer membrane protein TamA [Sulfurirhabdus autotrophica]